MSGQQCICFSPRETDIYLLIAKNLKTAFCANQDGMFFEVPIGSSRADILYVQTPKKHPTPLSCGVHAFEVKTRFDADTRRLKKQVRDYQRCADYVWVIGADSMFGHIPQNAGIMTYSANLSDLSAIRHPRHNGKSIDIMQRHKLLLELSARLKKKAKSFDEMARVDRPGESRTMIQKRL